MKKSAIFLFVLISFVSAYSQQNKIISIVPQPVKMEVGDGMFLFNNNTSIAVGGGDELLKLGDLLAGMVNSITGSKLKPVESSAVEANNNIVRINFDSSIKNDEGYQLKISKDGINISAKKGAGIFYAIQTLSQLFQMDQ